MSGLLTRARYASHVRNHFTFLHVGVRLDKYLTRTGGGGGCGRDAWNFWRVCVCVCAVRCVRILENNLKGEMLVVDNDPTRRVLDTNQLPHSPPPPLVDYTLSRGLNRWSGRWVSFLVGGRARAHYAVDVSCTHAIATAIAFSFFLLFGRRGLFF